MNSTRIIAFSLSILMCACASRPGSISASYVSHEKYMDHDCTQLATAKADAGIELTRVSALQDSAATGDAIGVFLLGIPFSQLSGDHAGEVAKCKGTLEAIDTAQIKKKCK